MFSRIREVVRVLSYREPHNNACFVFEEHNEPKALATGQRIASVMVGTLAVYVVALLSGPVSFAIQHLVPGRSVAMITLAGGVGALMMWMVETVRKEILQNIRTHIRLEERLAPFFGHRLESVFRALRGSTHAS